MQKGCMWLNYNPHPEVIGTTQFPCSLTIEKFDFPDYKREFTKDLYLTDDGTEKGPEMYYDGVFGMKDNMVVMMYANDVKTLYGMKVGADGSVDKNKVLIGTVTNRWKKSILSESRYLFEVTKDKTALVGCYVSSTDRTKMTLKALDENLKELWTNVAENPFKTGKSANIIKIHSLNGSVVYILASFGNEDDPEGYGLFVYNHNTNQVSAYQIKLGGTKFPNIIDFDVDKAGNAVVAGYYGDEKSGRTVIGSFNVRVDLSGEGILTKTTPFDHDFLAHIINDGKINNGKGIDELKVKKIVVTDEGSAIIAAEQVEHNAGQVDYYDGIVAKLNADGSTAWVKSVAKKQACMFPAEADKVCSFGMYVGAKAVYVVYNDSKKNGEKNSEDILGGDNSKLSANAMAANSGHPVAVCETIDMATGSVKKDIIAGEDDNKLRLFSTISLQNAPGKVYIYSGDRNGKSDEIGELSIE